MSGLALVGLMAAALAAAGLWGGQSDYVALLRAPENPQEVGSVLAILKSADIPVRQEGGQILVTASAKDRAYIELSGKSAWPADQSLDELKGLNDDWRMSDQGRRERARLSLQNRLGRMIGSVTGVLTGTVQIAEGNNAVFSSEHFDTTATVQVGLRRGLESLPDGVAETIRRMVAFGVTGLKPAAVVVVDNLGRIYEEHGSEFQAADTFEKLRRQKVEELNATLRNGLAPIVGPRIAVSSAIELNQDREKVVSHKVNPDETMVTDEKNKTRTQTGGTTETGGPVGTTSNVTSNSDATSGTPVSSSLTEEESEIHRDGSHEDREIIKGVGDIKKVTVGVLIPYAKGTPEPDAKTLDTCRNWVMKASGIADPQFVTVSSLAYDPAPAVQASRSDEAIAALLAHGDQLGVLLLAVGALVVLGMVLRRGGSRAAYAEEEGAGGVAGAVAAIRRARAEPLPEMTPEGTRFAEMESRVKEMVRKDPKMSAGLVKRWLMTAPK